jgi:hypothetical protein
MPSTRAALSAPSNPHAGALAPYAAPTTPTALADDNHPMDVDVSVTQLTAANAIKVQLFKRSTSPPSSDIPHDDKLRNPQDLAATNRFIIILDETNDEKTRNLHQKGFTSRQIIMSRLLVLATKPSLPNIY